MNLVEWSAYKQGQREILEKTIKVHENTIDKKEKEKDIYIQVRDLFASVGKATQDALIQYFENLGTSLLQTIYGSEYKFTLVFEIKRNKSECTPKVMKGDIQVDLKDEIGVGVVDVLSYAMRLAIWSLQKPRTEPVFILDEPFKYVDKNKRSLIGEALQGLTESLGAQTIMISHDDELIDIGNSAYQISITNNVSDVRRVR